MRTSILTRWVSLLLIVSLTAPSLQGASSKEKTAATGNRYLFVVENSSAIKKRDDSIRQTLFDLVNSGVRGRMQSGDTFGVWTFNSDTDTQFPMQVWEPSSRLELAAKANIWVKSKGYQKRSNIESLINDLNAVISRVPELTVVILSSGADPIVGTPFDREINTFYRQMAAGLEKGQEPFLTGLVARAGFITAYCVGSPSEPLSLPPPPPRPLVKKTNLGKNGEAFAKAGTNSPARRPAQSIIVTRESNEQAATNAAYAKLLATTQPNVPPATPSSNLSVPSTQVATATPAQTVTTPTVPPAPGTVAGQEAPSAVSGGVVTTLPPVKPEGAPIVAVSTSVSAHSPSNGTPVGIATSIGTAAVPPLWSNWSSTVTEQSIRTVATTAVVVAETVITAVTNPASVISPARTPEARPTQTASVQAPQASQPTSVVTTATAPVSTPPMVLPTAISAPITVHARQPKPVETNANSHPSPTASSPSVAVGTPAVIPPTSSNVKLILAVGLLVGAVGWWVGYWQRSRRTVETSYISRALPKNQGGNSKSSTPRNR